MEIKSLLLMSLTSQVYEKWPMRREEVDENTDIRSTYISISVCSSIGMRPSSQCTVYCVLSSYQKHRSQFSLAYKDTVICYTA